MGSHFRFRFGAEDFSETEKAAIKAGEAALREFLKG
jgi:hypothetical protein